MFDAQEYVAALEVPTFKAQDGTIYRGRILSVDQWLPLAASMRSAKADKAPLATRHMVRRLVMAFFPHPWWKPGHSAAYWILRLPPRGQLKAIWSFTESQGKAMGTPITPPPGVQELLSDASVSPTGT